MTSAIMTSPTPTPSRHAHRPASPATGPLATQPLDVVPDPDPLGLREIAGFTLSLVFAAALAFVYALGTRAFLETLQPPPPPVSALQPVTVPLDPDLGRSFAGLP